MMENYRKRKEARGAEGSTGQHRINQKTDRKMQGKEGVGKKKSKEADIIKQH